MARVHLSLKTKKIERKEDGVLFHYHRYLTCPHSCHSFLTLIIIDPEYIVYMGRDKFENEELIRYGWPEDVWYV